MQNSTQGFRLSPQQKHIWLLQENQPGQSCCVTSAWLLTGELQLPVAERALCEVVQSHEILRTTFQRPQGVRTPFQVVTDDVNPILQVLDLSALQPGDHELRISELLAEEQSRRFDLERAPLLRVNLLKLSARQWGLIVSLPALCADAETLRNFIAELSRNYDALICDHEYQGDAMQYADFAEWQNELREAEDEAAGHGRAYWEELSSEEILAPLLPFEKPSEDLFTTASVSVQLGKTLSDQLETIAKSHAVTLSTLLFATLQVLIWRLSGRSSFVLFNLFEGRKVDDLSGALGLYDTYLPVRCHGQDVLFGDLITAVSTEIDNAHEWQDYFDPFATDNQIAFEYSEQRHAQFGGSISASLFEEASFLQPFKLRLCCTNSAEGLKATFNFNAGRFDRASIEDLAAYWQRLVTQTSFYGSQTATTGAIDILTAEQRQWLIHDLNQTLTPFSANKCIHELFEAQVERTPEAIALIFEDIELSYAVLNARSNQLAHLFKNRGLKPNDRVGLNIERGADAIVSLLGILKAGGAYVPLNPEHPRERIAFQLSQSGARFLVRNTGSADDGLDFSGETIDLEVQRPLLATLPETNLTHITSSENLVYVIYTSGSTGVAKGVAVRHRNLVNYSEFILRLLEVSEPLQFATVSTITADLGNTCIFPALLSGGCLHVLSYETAMEAELLRNYTRARPFDVLKIVPSHLQALLSSQTDGQILPSKFLLLGGEALPWELANRIAEFKPECHVFNHYGPTETTVGSLTWSFDANVSNSSQTVPIGLPIANTRAYVLDEYFQPQPSGVSGELYIGGAGVTAGYLAQPAETAARFMPDPFSSESGARLYRTGDLVRRLSDGAIEFLGRVDNQIKVRGFRVELGEIEAVLSSHPAVQQAVVVGAASQIESHTAAASGDRLIAYVVSSTNSVSADELRGFLAQRLPDYMIPSVYVPLKSIPLTRNGKVDRAALPAPDDSRPDLQQVFTAPRTPTEEALAAIWAGLLKVEAVGVHDNFFELGGHSLLATQVVSRMRQTFETDIPLRSLFESPTVAGLAEKIDTIRLNDTARLLAELEQLSDDEAERMLGGPATE